MPDEQPESELTPAPKFTDWIAEHKNGLLDVDLAEAFASVVQGVMQTGKAGTVTLTLKVSKQGDMVSVVEEIKQKRPEVVDARLYWVDENGLLSRDNPLAPRMIDT